MKKTLSIILSIVMVISLLGVLPITAQAQEFSGSCGENVTYKFNDETGILTISGTGAMNDFSEVNPEYYTYRSDIVSVVIQEGVTYIGTYAFSNYQNIINVEIPASVREIGKNAFANCIHLIDVYFSGTVNEWNTVTIGSANTYIVEYANIVFKNIAEPVYKIKYDFNGGTKDKKESYIEYQVCYVPDVTVANFITRLDVVAPEGKELDYIEANGYKYEIGSSFIFSENTTYKYFWKDAHTHKFVKTVKKATLESNGSIVKKCSCGATSGSKTIIYRPKKFKLSKSTYTYDGKAKKPSVSVTDANGKKIGSSNYTLTYAKGRKNVGSYNISIKFKGNYSGTKKVSFVINPKGTSIVSLTSPKKKCIKVTWKKQTSQTTGYEIIYGTTPKFGVFNTVTVKGNKNTSKTIKVFYSERLYVKVYTYKIVKGETYYSTSANMKVIDVK